MVEVGAEEAVVEAATGVGLGDDDEEDVEESTSMLPVADVSLASVELVVADCATGAPTTTDPVDRSRRWSEWCSQLLTRRRWE